MLRRRPSGDGLQTALPKPGPLQGCKSRGSGCARAGSPAVPTVMRCGPLWTGG